MLAASTHSGEERVVAEVHRALAPTHPGLLTVIVPRHPQRGAALASELDAADLNVARRARDDAVAADTHIYLADTLGELGLFYRLAEIAFVGCEDISEEDYKKKAQELLKKIIG